MLMNSDTTEFVWTTELTKTLEFQVWLAIKVIDCNQVWKCIGKLSAMFETEEG